MSFMEIVYGSRRGMFCESIEGWAVIDQYTGEWADHPFELRRKALESQPVTHVGDHRSDPLTGRHLEMLVEHVAISQFVRRKDLSELLGRNGSALKSLLWKNGQIQSS